MLVNCVAYTEGRKLADIPVEDISEYLKRPNCFVWVALKDPEPSELEMMQEEFDLHELAVDDARHGHQRPKIEEYGDSLFAVLQTIELKDDDLVLGEVHIFVAPTTSSRPGAEPRKGSPTYVRAASASRTCCRTAPDTSCTPSWTRSSIVTSRCSTRWRASSRPSSSRSSSRTRRARTSRPSTR